MLVRSARIFTDARTNALGVAGAGGQPSTSSAAGRDRHG
jgi:hypothetical protein